MGGTCCCWYLVILIVPHTHLIDLFQLQYHLKDKIAALKDKWGWGSPKKIGLHIRRGDRKDLLKWSFSDYMKIAEELRNQTGIQEIYLASDDLNRIVSEELPTWKSKGWKFYYLLNEEIIETGEISHVPQVTANKSEALSYQWNKNTPKQITENMLTDLSLLSDCSVFVGSQRSMFGWVASRLLVGKGNEVMCPWWIDAPSNAYGYWVPTPELSQTRHCV